MKVNGPALMIYLTQKRFSGTGTLIIFSENASRMTWPSLDTTSLMGKYKFFIVRTKNNIVSIDRESLHPGRNLAKTLTLCSRYLMTGVPQWDIPLSTVRLSVHFKTPSGHFNSRSTWNGTFFIYFIPRVTVFFHLLGVLLKFLLDMIISIFQFVML